MPVRPPALPLNALPARNHTAARGQQGGLVCVPPHPEPRPPSVLTAQCCPPTLRTFRIECSSGHRKPRATVPGLGSYSVSPAPCQAMNLLHELQFAREFEKAVQEAYPELLLALLTQTHYISELNLPEEPQPGQEAQPLATPSPQR